MRASINQEGSSGSVAVLLYPPQDLVDEVTKYNHALSHFDLLDTLYLQMNKRGSRHFVAVLPRLVLFALSSELRGDKSVTYMWEDASQAFMWASHPSKESSICQLPSERPEVLIRGVPDLEDWLRRGRSPPHIEVRLRPNPSLETTMLTYGVVRRCLSSRPKTRSDLVRRGRRRRSSRWSQLCPTLADFSRSTTTRIQLRLLFSEEDVDRAHIWMEKSETERRHSDDSEPLASAGPHRSCLSIDRACPSWSHDELDGGTRQTGNASTSNCAVGGILLQALRKQGLQDLRSRKGEVEEDPGAETSRVLSIQKLPL